MKKNRKVVHKQNNNIESLILPKSNKMTPSKCDYCARENTTQS